MTRPADFAEHCNADVRGCTGGWDDELDEPGPCSRCAASELAEHRHWSAYFAGFPREPTRDEYIADMRDGGRVHLADEWMERP